MTSLTSSHTITLLVEVPICAFRPYESREYQDTHPFPPPSAVYGMLLSLCGVRREEKHQHQGVRMVLAMEGVPERGKVFRKFRRGKDLGDLRPDYQDLLIGLKLWVWLANGSDQGQPPLVEQVSTAIEYPNRVKRSGGLSLGESSYLVDSIAVRKPNADLNMHFLKPDPSGFYNISTWVDHIGNKHVRQRFGIESLSVAEGEKDCWIVLRPPNP